jgi:hypothetical protein
LLQIRRSMSEKIGSKKYEQILIIMLLSNSKRSEAHRFFEKQGFSSDLKKGLVKYRSQLRGE